jgi:hypothetical protein
VRCGSCGGGLVLKRWHWWQFRETDHSKSRPARPLDAALLEGLAEPVAVKEKSQ